MCVCVCVSVCAYVGSVVCMRSAAWVCLCGQPVCGFSVWGFAARGVSVCGLYAELLNQCVTKKGNRMHYSELRLRPNDASGNPCLYYAWGMKSEKIIYIVQFLQ